MKSKSIKANLTAPVPTKTLPPAPAKKKRAPRAAKWEMPDAKGLFAFINRTPLVASLLYDINLLPEQIDNQRHWNYMVNVCSHMGETYDRALDEAAKIATGYATCGCNGEHGQCNVDDAPLSIAAAITALKDAA